MFCLIYNSCSKYFSPQQIRNKIINHVDSFNYLESSISYEKEVNIDNKQIFENKQHVQTNKTVKKRRIN